MGKKKETKPKPERAFTDSGGEAPLAAQAAGAGPGSDGQVLAQSPAMALTRQDWDIPLTEPTLDPDDPVLFSDPDRQSLSWPPRPLPLQAPSPPKGFQRLEDVPFYSSRPVRIEEIIDSLLETNPHADEDLVRRAYVRAAIAHKDMVRSSGEPYLNHPLAVASILTEMKLDAATVAAGLLHDTVEDTPLTIPDVDEEFGPEVANIVDGVTKIAKINFSSESERRATNLRKMFLSMLKDLRVIFVKLADRLHNMRTLGYLAADKQIAISRETLDFFAPLASRLGIHKIQAELEDLALFYLNPMEFETIRSYLSVARDDRKHFVNDVKSFLSEKMAEWNIPCEIEGRPKHIYSIFRKMSAQNLPLEQIYDLVAFRIIVDDVQQCYMTLGVIHTIFKPIPGRLKDYINLPKSNGYQSIHTAVIGLHNFRMEVQIRTKAMHMYAEEGIAAHWRYKDGGAASSEELARIATLRNIINWQSIEDPNGFLNTLKESLAANQFIYVFTPGGRPIELPNGATVLDFAYSVHTDVGNSCQSAMVNDAMCPIRHALNNGDVVKINTGSKPNVKADWLRYVVSAKAKYKIRQYLATQEKKNNIKIGEELIRGTMTRLKLSKAKLSQSVLDGLGFSKLDDLNFAVGSGRLRIKTVIDAIKPGLEVTPPPPERPLPLPVTPVKQSERLTPMILVDGHENISVNFPKCCFPMPGEPIKGFLTHTKGVSIHSANCPALGGLDKSRFVTVSWANSQPLESTTDIFIKVRLFDQKYLPNVIGAMVSHSARIAEFQQSSEFPNQIWFRVPVKDYAQCQELLNALLAMEWEVAQVERFQPPFIPFPSDAPQTATRF
ncbi:MAG: bifunctional (p)ppGpp synthetase/guanosine-3',5'-bis(diphosphate) 3'-pyrophosphohydrolase [Deltaproteobacteria bacterium]|jgi:GTP pyrophosphokinase|nr:bifunctional (p)ppGpp synthetase/guanosine-3',5'-bis(diphosphate) 3'-pyrophosphohydrolase [Deltaproteobacteria bacterium]